MFGKEKSSDERRFRVAPDVSTEMVGERASAAGVLLFSAVLFVVVLACVLGVGALAHHAPAERVAARGQGHGGHPQRLRRGLQRRRRRPVQGVGVKNI